MEEVFYFRNIRNNRSQAGHSGDASGPGSLKGEYDDERGYRKPD